MGRFVEGAGCPAIGGAPLVFLAAIKYSVRGANNGLRHHVVRQTETRAEIHLIPRNHITRNLAAGNLDVGERGREVWRQSGILVLALGYIKGEIVENKIRLPSKPLIER